MLVSQNKVNVLGVMIREDDKGMLCVNDLYRASGSKPKDMPKEWLRLKATKELIAYDQELNRGGITPLYTIQSGKVLLTFAASILFLDYAAWLSVEVRYAAMAALFDKMNNHKVEINQAKEQLNKSDNDKAKLENIVELLEKQNSYYKNNAKPVIDAPASLTKLFPHLSRKQISIVLDELSERVDYKSKIVTTFSRKIKTEYVEMLQLSGRTAILVNPDYVDEVTEVIIKLMKKQQEDALNS